jgi:hypothetical protein
MRSRGGQAAGVALRELGGGGDEVTAGLLCALLGDWAGWQPTRRRSLNLQRLSKMVVAGVLPLSIGRAPPSPRARRAHRLEEAGELRATQGRPASSAARSRPL